MYIEQMLMDSLTTGEQNSYSQVKVRRGCHEWWATPVHQT